MPTYVLSYGKTPDDDPKVAMYPTRPAAIRGATREPAGRAAFVIENAADMPFGNVGMRDLFNAILANNPETDNLPAPVERFSDRGAAIRRLLELFGKVAVPAPTDIEEPASRPARASTTRGATTTMPRTASTEKKFNPSTKKAQVLSLMTGEYTDAEIMSRAGLPNERQVVAHAAVLKRSHSIEHERVGKTDDNPGRLLAKYPHGKSYEDFVRSANEEEQVQEEQAAE